MKKKDLCVWYNQSSGVKRAYDLGSIDRKWVEKKRSNGGKDCVRKKRFEEERYVSPDYVLPDGTISERIKAYLER